MQQTPQQRQNMINDIATIIDRATRAAAAVAKSNAPIDTSSLAESTVSHPAKVKGGAIVGSYSSGGVDFTGQVMPKTQKLGKDPKNYANKQEIKTGYFSSGIPALLSELEK